MLTTTDRTPAQWARFLAEKVMGWKHAPEPCIYRRPNGASVYIGEKYLADLHGGQYWSPWENITDAREVLERLVEIIGTPNANIYQTAVGWGVSLGRYKVDVPGPHKGPAICLLAKKIINATKKL